MTHTDAIIIIALLLAIWTGATVKGVAKTILSLAVLAVVLAAAGAAGIYVSSINGGWSGYGAWYGWAAGIGVVCFAVQIAHEIDMISIYGWAGWQEERSSADNRSGASSQPRSMP